MDDTVGGLVYCMKEVARRGGICAQVLYLGQIDLLQDLSDDFATKRPRVVIRGRMEGEAWAQLVTANHFEAAVIKRDVSTAYLIAYTFAVIILVRCNIQSDNIIIWV